MKTNNTMLIAGAALAYYLYSTKARASTAAPRITQTGASSTAAQYGEYISLGQQIVGLFNSGSGAASPTVSAPVDTWSSSTGMIDPTTGEPMLDVVATDQLDYTAVF